jgi:uncharacterized membrane-anchored protein YhcB (DUF1043 family)
MSSIMSSMELWVWPSIAMVIFLGVFIGVAIRVLRATKAECEHNASIPLCDGTEQNQFTSSRTHPALAPSQKGEAR